MSLVRFEAGRWTKPYALSHDGWKIPGCPVNGPALAAAGLVVAAAWFSMLGEQPAVQVATSHDGGATFSNPVRIDQGDPLGRVDVVLLPRGEALVVWLETSSPSAQERRTEIRARRAHPDGELDAPFTVAPSNAERSSGFPQVARRRDSLYFAWTGPGAPPRVRMARLDLPRSWR